MGYDGYPWYNFLILANKVNVAGRVLGLPADYKPAHRPLIPAPAAGQTMSIPTVDWETNVVCMTLKNGTTQRVNYDTGLHAWPLDAFPGLWDLGMDMSLFKTFRFTERLKARIRMNAFNAFNMPGLVLPVRNTGLLLLQNSNNAPRRIQFSARFLF